MATFIYVANIWNPERVASDIPVFAFDFGDPLYPADDPNVWESSKLRDVGALGAFEFRLSQSPTLTIVIPIPIAMRLFGPKASYERLEILASKDSAPLQPLATFQVRGVTVVHSRKVGKGIFKMSGSQMTSVPKAGGGIDMAMFTPAAVSLSIAH